MLHTSNTSSRHNIVASAGQTSADMAIEAMVSDVGLFRKRSSLTVNGLLRMSGNKSPFNDKEKTNDRSVIASMARRLQVLEVTTQEQTKQIEERNARISELTEECDAVKLQLTATQKEVTEEVLTKSRLLTRYIRQVHEMETFLNDYGLIWAGFRADDDSTIVTAANESGDESTNNSIDFDAVLASLKELNVLANDGVRIVTSNNKAEFSPPPSVDLILFQDGMFLHHGPWRAYSQATCQSFIHDILDGYFPTELKQQYPEGVMFNVQDQRDKRFHKSLINAKSTPKSTVKNGKVIDIRGSVVVHGKDLVTPDQGTVLVHTDTVALLESQEPDRPKTPGDITTLQVKLRTRTLLLKMRFSDTIAQVRHYVTPYCDKEGIAAYELRTSFPRRVYSDDQVTLQSAGLTPNATLLLHPINSAADHRQAG